MLLHAPVPYEQVHLIIVLFNCSCEFDGCQAKLHPETVTSAPLTRNFLKATATMEMAYANAGMY